MKQPIFYCADPEMPRLVAFTGLAQSGKSTAADVLVCDGFQRVKFAGPLKAAMSAMLEHSGMDPRRVLDCVEGSQKERHLPELSGRSARFAMQTLGTEWGRDTMDGDLWINMARARIEKFLDEGGAVVVDDARFQNEVDLIRSLGGLVIGIECPGVGIASDHVSEKFDFEVDATIQNDGDLEDLDDAVFATLVRLTDLAAA